MPTFGSTHFIVGFPHDLCKATRTAIGQEVAQQKATKTRSVTSKTVVHNDKIVQAFFSPDDDLQDALIQLIQQESSSIRIAIYTFTDTEIAQALIDAHQRGVNVQIIVDPSQGKDRYSKVSTLQAAGIKVFFYNPDYVADKRSNLMHNKFAIFGNTKKNKVRVWTGSYNFTAAARTRNQENAVLFTDTAVFEDYLKQFCCLKDERCIGCDRAQKHLHLAQTPTRNKRGKYKRG
jgi:phosphatidylserine/phosphatidylglycerophosphate/cardiolipin synthase-like enzyme